MRRPASTRGRCASTRRFPGACDVFLDGIAGDILGDPVGWLKLTGLAIDERDPDSEIENIARHAIRSDFDSVLAPRAWPSAEDLRADLHAYLRGLRQRANLGELAFLLLRQRRAIALWSQQLPPPGVVPLYPYLDADYLRATLALSSEAKHQINLQRFLSAGILAGVLPLQWQP